MGDTLVPASDVTDLRVTSISCGSSHSLALLSESYISIALRSLL